MTDARWSSNQSCSATHKVLAKGNDLEKYRFLCFQAIDVDPWSVVEWLGTAKFDDSEYRELLRFGLVSALARESLDEATALIEAGTDATLRARGYAELCEIRRDLDPARLKELLAQAAINAPPVAREQLRWWR